MNIAGKKIVLTGASAGIGREILQLLAEYKGTKIVAVARDTDDIPRSEKIFPFAADVSTKEGVDKVFEYAKDAIGGIDIFIANAGFGYIEKLEEPDWHHIENIYNLNVFSPIYTLEKLVAESKNSPVMFACTVSGAGLASLPAYSLYCSTKAALHHFIQTYRYEKNKNIKITAVYPVATKTKFFDKASGEKSTPMPFPVQEVKTVAKKYIRGIEKEKKTVYPSLLLRLSYPIGRAFPFLMKLYSLSERRKVKKQLGL